MYTQWRGTTLPTLQAAALARADKLLAELSAPAAAAQEAGREAGQDEALQAEGGGHDGLTGLLRPVEGSVAAGEHAAPPAAAGAAAKSELAGVPGARPKGSRKVQQLGAKALLPGLEGFEGSAQEVRPSAVPCPAAPCVHARRCPVLCMLRMHLWTTCACMSFNTVQQERLNCVTAPALCACSACC